VSADRPINADVPAADAPDPHPRGPEPAAQVRPEKPAATAKAKPAGKATPEHTTPPARKAPPAKPPKPKRSDERFIN